jgi:glyoxylase-like metal-dependent hydrolase (beta-lactamase superfamily II)
VAIAVFGLAACSSDSSDSLSGSAPTQRGGAGDADTEASSTSGGSEPSETAPGSDPTGGDVEPEPGTLAWERVNLGFVSAYVLARGKELAVVDTGGSGSEDEILGAITTLGGNWDDVAHVILTHAHGDHAGSINAVLENAPTAAGYAGAADLSKITAVRDLTALNNGDEVFGMQIIGTPGHTPGHISVFDEMSGLLLAGDAMNEQAGRIIGANPDFSQDMDLAAASIQRMATRTVDTVLFGHGEPVLEDAGQALQELAASL